MNAFDLFRPLLFSLPPETAHRAAMSLYRVAAPVLARQQKGSPVTYLGLTFPNRIGLAAGFDKNGRYLDLLERMGFGFVEIGTITPKPQSGNPLPRIFRFPPAHALINRMGFPNDGLEAISERVERSSYRGIKGANISKNLATPAESAIDDFVTCFRRVRRWADYIVINVSSPNTKGLRDLQSAQFLSDLSTALGNEERLLVKDDPRSVPLLVKISPDLADESLREIAEFVLQSPFSGIIATNTTLSREHLGVDTAETGGLSGAPLFERSLACVRNLRRLVGKDLLIIGAGGIMSGAQARQMREAGADLLQIYTGLIYKGPEIVHELIEATG